MGTRADFYVGKHENAEWIGSIAWDGYRDGIPYDILNAKTEEDFRAAVKKELSSRDDGTFPEDGWPWPWETSATSDCSYWFDGGLVWEVGYAKENSKRVYIIHGKTRLDEHGYAFHDEGVEFVRFPNMKDRMNVTYGSRSGLIILRA